MKTFGIMFLVMAVLGIFALIGEVMCIVKAVKCDWKEPYKAEVIYTVSACTGLGAIVGWINIEDK